jgi:hypothetical protein
MTSGTQGRSGFPEKVLVLRSMRKVASDAISHQHGLMDVFGRKFRFHVGVATIADLVGSIFQYCRKIRSMGVVAGSALPSSKRLMLDLRFLDLFYLGMAAIAQVVCLR